MALDDILVTVNADISGYVEAIEQATQATDQLGANLEKTSKSIQSQSNSLENQGGDLESAGDSYDDYRESMLEAGQTQIKVAGIIQTASTVMMGAIGALIYQVTDFEDAFVGVEKTVGGTTDEMARIEGEIRDLSLELPRTSTEIAEVAEEAGRLGIKQEDISQFTETMIRMGESSDLSASEAAQSMAKLMNIMGTSEGDVENLGSAISHMGNRTATSESQILELSRRLAGSANQVGITESELVGLSASMSDVGIQAESGGTAMQKTLLSMNSAVSSGGDELESFANTAGMTGEEFRQAFEEDASGALVAFLVGLDDVSDSGGDVVSTLGEVGLSNERTMNTLLNLSSSHEELAENMDVSNDAWSENTALAEESDRVFNTLSNKIKTLVNSVREIVLILGTPFATVLSAVIGQLEMFLDLFVDLARWFDSWPDSLKVTVAAIMSLIPVALSLAAGITAITGAVQVGIALFPTFVAGIRAVQTALMFLATNPIGIAIGAIALLGAAVVSLSAHFNDQSNAQKELAEDTDDLIDSSEELRESSEKNSESFQDEMESIERSVAGREKAIDSISDLMDKESRSAEEKSLIKAKVDELNDSMEGLNISYDEQADSLSHSTEELSKRSEFMEDEAKLIASQERMVEIAKERNEADLELKNINKQRERLNKQTDEFGSISSKTLAQINALNAEEAELKETMKELGIEYEDTSETMMEKQKEVDEAVADGVANMTLSYDDLNESQQSMVDDMAGTYEELADSATDMFEKIPEDAEVSFNEMQEILDHNAEMVGDWGDNIQELADRGVSEGLIERLRDAGPEAAAETQAIVDATDEELEEFDESFIKGMDNAEEALMAGLEDIDENTVELIAGIVRGMMTTFQEEFDEADFASLGERPVKEIGEGLENGQEVLKDASFGLVQRFITNPLENGISEGNFQGKGRQVPISVGSGVSGGSGNASSAVGAMAGDLISQYTNKLGGSNSGKFQGYGQGIPNSLQGGINSSASAPVSAVTNMTSNMTSSADIGMNNMGNSMDTGVSNVGTITDQLPSLADTSMGSMLNSFQTGGSNTSSYMSTVPGMVTSPFSGLNVSLSTLGTSAMGGFLSGISSMSGSIISKAKSIASSVTTTIGNALKIKSPSRVMMEIGGNVVKGMEEGLEYGLSSVERASMALSKAATPDQPKLAGLGVGDMQGHYRDMSASIQTKVDDRTSDKHSADLLEDIRNGLRGQEQMIVEMDGREVGRLVEPHVSSERDRRKVKRRRGRGENS